MSNDKRFSAAVKCAGATASGAAVGAAAYGVVGGVGLAIGGSAIGVTLGPFIAIGAGLGLTAYGIYWLGKQVGGRRQE